MSLARHLQDPAQGEPVVGADRLSGNFPRALPVPDITSRTVGWNRGTPSRGRKLGAL